ncbi:MAG TPA: ATP-binding protein, partial [Actinomycetaceae bacterium]|nr:ATP-binding protein [Actinomycetaceae bacterium]
SGEDRARLRTGPLVAGAVLEVLDLERPFASRALRVPDRVVAHLLGDDAPAPEIGDLLSEVPPVEWGDAAALATGLREGARFAYVREFPTGSARVLAARALATLGWQSVNAEVAPGTEAAALRTQLRLLTREAQLGGAGLILGPIAALVEQPGTLDRLAPDVPTILVGSDTWDPTWSRRIPLLVDAPASTAADRAAQWAAQLPDAEPATIASTAAFRLSPEQIHRAAAAARTQATADGGGAVTAKHVTGGARAENGTALERLARRISPAVSWDDLVVGPTVDTALREVAARARHREQVLGDWRMRPGGGRGNGVAALFAGDSGTGKTMSAEVVAHDLGLDLYVVNLATTVDKYIGETEKNLERIFLAADGMNAVLLFDEADSIFGKRSEVKDAHDRYANIESAYLLQRMESFDGLIILATNLRANIDDAFTRRLDVVVDFPLPHAADRRRLWDLCLGEAMPRAEGIDLDFCAAAFELAGGAIRSAAVTAAYLAAEAGGPLTMTHVVTAIQREYRKLGRLTLPQEFGDYWALLEQPDRA